MNNVDVIQVPGKLPPPWFWIGSFSCLAPNFLISWFPRQDPCRDTLHFRTRMWRATPRHQPLSSLTRPPISEVDESNHTIECSRERKRQRMDSWIDGTMTGKCWCCCATPPTAWHWRSTGHLGVRLCGSLRLILRQKSGSRLERPRKISHPQSHSKRIALQYSNGSKLQQCFCSTANGSYSIKSGHAIKP